MINLSPKELKAVAKIRGIKGYKSIPEDELLGVLTLSKPVRKGKKSKSNFSEIMVGKGIRGGICHAIHRYAKTNNKYVKYYDKNEESSFLEYLDANNIYGWAMSQQLPADSFKFVKNMSKIDEDFIKNYDKIKDIFLK